MNNNEKNILISYEQEKWRKNAAIWVAITGNGEKAEGTVNGRTSVLNWNRHKNIAKWGYNAFATSYAKLVHNLKHNGWILMSNL